MTGENFSSLHCGTELSKHEHANIGVSLSEEHVSIYEKAERDSSSSLFEFLW